MPTGRNIVIGVDQRLYCLDHPDNLNANPPVFCNKNGVPVPVEDWHRPLSTLVILRGARVFESKKGVALSLPRIKAGGFDEIERTCVWVA